MSARRFLTARRALAGMAAAAIAAALLYPAGAAASTAAASGPPGNGGCVTTFQPPSTWVVVCSNGGGTPGGPGGGGGGGGGGGKVSCTLQPLSPAQVSFLGLPPAPKGEEWAAITCPGNSPFGGVTLVADGAGAAPAVTPQELLQEVEGQLTVPTLNAATAPPRGRDGLVGLPEWFWIAQAAWHPVRTQRLQVGAVWAQVTATPVQLGFVPGGGLAGRTCPGPGTPFTSRAPDQTSACSFTYSQSSATQEGGTYAASVTVTWRVTWAGFSPATGPVGGLLNAGLQVADPINLKVAEGQALVNGTGVGQ
jgi:hypothetical protein